MVLIPDPCQLQNSTGVLQWQTLLRRWTPSRIQVVLARTEQRTTTTIWRTCTLTTLPFVYKQTGQFCFWSRWFNGIIKHTSHYKTSFTRRVGQKIATKLLLHLHFLPTWLWQQVTTSIWNIWFLYQMLNKTDNVEDFAVFLSAWDISRVYSNQ